MKDIFIDTNVAINLVTPLTDSYKKFINWLYQDGILVVNQKLLTEFIGGNQTLNIVINKLLISGRLRKMNQKELSKFSFTKAEEKILLSNRKDRLHLKTVLLSNRKMALSIDRNFKMDINNFRRVDGKKAICCDCPSKIDYAN